MLLINIHHIGIAVHDLDVALAEYRRQYQVEPVHREVVENQGVEEAMIAIGGSHVQLLAPLSADSPVGKFLEARGEGAVDSFRPGGAIMRAPRPGRQERHMVKDLAAMIIND